MTAPAKIYLSDPFDLVAFDLSLPTRYRVEFRLAERVAHARICALRGVNAVSVGLFPSGKVGQTAICLNAEDRPGVLSLASAAFSLLGFEVQEAVAYLRRMPNGSPDEILDVFWLKDPSKLLAAADIAAFSNLLSEYIAGRAPERNPLHGCYSSGPSGTVVRFVDDRQGALSVLEVETADRFGLLWDISRTLTECGLVIVSSEIRTHGPRVTDKFTVEEKSRLPISAARRLEIQTAVLSTLED